ncbi:MAG: flagellar hook assembly protein FlgD [Blastocatellia bacterium]
MQINNILSPGSGPAEAAGGRAAGNVDRDTFLTLLVAQLKHQDPLAPQDGAEFVAQLAQFNSLEQLMNINDRLTRLIDLQSPQQPADRQPNHPVLK